MLTIQVNNATGPGNTMEAVIMFNGIPLFTGSAVEAGVHGDASAAIATASNEFVASLRASMSKHIVREA